MKEVFQGIKVGEIVQSIQAGSEGKFLFNEATSSWMLCAAEATLRETKIETCEDLAAVMNTWFVVGFLVANKRAVDWYFRNHA